MTVWPVCVYVLMCVRVCVKGAAGAGGVGGSSFLLEHAFFAGFLP